jgi:hypothetical protein
MKAASPRRWLIWFWLTLGGLSALALWAALRLPSYRDPPHNFYAMQHGEYFNPSGLTRRQSGGLKLGFAESFDPPPIGVFGNHIIWHFGADAFGAPESAETFFNYGYANVSLPEMLRLMRHMEARQRLPSDLMIVAITPPNADNGRFIIDNGNELPPDLMLSDALSANVEADAHDVAEAAWRALQTRLHEVFNYNTLILGLTYDPQRAHATGPAICADGAPREALPSWFGKLPYTIRHAINPYLVVNFCAPDAWVGAFRRDGSSVAPLQQRLVRNEHGVGVAKRGLRAGDEREIARQLRAIDALGQRNGAAVVFLITPVFETERSDSVVNRIFDRALALAPELEVIDHRALREDPALFVDYLHPAPGYYRLVVDELRRRGLVEAGPDQTSIRPDPIPGR